MGRKKDNPEAALMLLLENLKKGKTHEQGRCIEYLYTPAVEKGGCLGKKKGLAIKDLMTIDEYIEYVQKSINALNLKQKALEKIGLDETQISEIPPVVLSSFVFRGDDVVCKTEESESGVRKTVSNKYSVTWIFFSDTQIYTFKYIFDSMSDNAIETTNDFFYKDITCIKTEHEVEEHIYEDKKGCGCFKKKESRYYHNNREYDYLEITVPGGSFSFWCRTTDTIEQSIQATKAMIREKKNS